MIQQRAVELNPFFNEMSNLLDVWCYSQWNS